MKIFTIVAAVLLTAATAHAQFINGGLGTGGGSGGGTGFPGCGAAGHATLFTALPSPGVAGQLCEISDSTGCVYNQQVSGGSGNPNTNTALLINVGADTWVGIGNCTSAPITGSDVSGPDLNTVQVVGLQGSAIPAPAANSVYVRDSGNANWVNQISCSNPLSTTGDLLLGLTSVGTCPTRLGDIAAGALFTSGGVGANPGYNVADVAVGSFLASSSTTTQPVYTKQINFLRVANGCTTSGTPSTVTSCITTGAITAPTGATGQLWRIWADWVACTGTSAITTSYQVSDGTNTWADREIVTNLTSGTCSGGSGLSPVTYANGATPTITLNVSSSGASSTISATSTTTGMTKTTYLDVSFVPVNN